MNLGEDRIDDAVLASVSRAKSVVFTEEGLTRSRERFEALFGKKA